jgi:putative transposase
MQLYALEYPQFLTATVQHWKNLLAGDEYKKIITDALSFLQLQEKVSIYGFVIMVNHVHIIWQSKGNNSIHQIQNSFIKHTSKQFKLQVEKDGRLPEYEVNAVDRKYNFWKRDSLSIELFTPEAFAQKLKYIHYNPVKAGICSLPEDYYFPSALFYEKGIDNFGFLTHHLDTG